MGSLKKEVEIFTAYGSAYAYERHKNGELTGEYGFQREITLTINSPYGTEATVNISIDDAKEAVKIIQDAIKKASVSEKQLIKSAKNRSSQLDAFLGVMREEDEE